MNQMITIHTDGSVTVMALASAPPLQDLQKAVGGYIEQIPGFTTYNDQPAVAFCNEEGKIMGLPLNETATALWTIAAGADVLVGDIVVIVGDKAFLEQL